jgi:uncharacterized surface protein with fasciclin (FAS1) repeats
MFYKQLSLLALAGQAFAQNTPTLAQALNSSSNLSQLSGVLGLVPNIAQSLGSAQNITILAPSNAAFAKIDNATLAALAANPDMLSALLQYHVLNGTVYGSQVTNMSAFVPTLLTNPQYTNVSFTDTVKPSCLMLILINRSLGAKGSGRNCATATLLSTVDYR